VINRAKESKRIVWWFSPVLSFPYDSITFNLRCVCLLSEFCSSYLTCTCLPMQQWKGGGSEYWAVAAVVVRAVAGGTVIYYQANLTLFLHLPVI
jgi:hypothetical protein